VRAVRLIIVASATQKCLSIYHAANWGWKNLTPKVLAMIGCLATLAPAFAQEDLKSAPERLNLQVTSDPPGERCRRIEKPDAAPLASVSLHRTFHDDFDEHPLSAGRWVPHYAGGAAWPEARYWGGDGSDFKRKTTYNGEQQIYVDPRYGGPQAASVA